MKRSAILLGAFLLSLVSGLVAQPQESRLSHISGVDRDNATSMMEMIAGDVKKHYYDPTFHGVDWDARVKEAKTRIDNSPSLNAALSHIAGALDALNDSHTYFLPPARPYRHDYGFQMQMIGNRCWVIRVRAQRDAESQGVKPGDEVLAINGYAPNRDIFWKMMYVNKVLRPKPLIQLALRNPSGVERQLDIAAKMESKGAQVKDLMDSLDDLAREGEDYYLSGRPRWVELGDLVIIKIPEFSFSESEAADLIGKARKHKALILDLRSNGGGAEDSLKSLLGIIFDHDITIGDRVRRNDRKTLIAKSHHNPYSGKLAVLVDSNSASASELFARIVQLEKRGTVLGDHSSGSVMEAKHYGYHTGFTVMALFGASITEANLIMTDGNSLEHVGVTPDETVLPTADDLASGRDPVLARAAEVLGFKVSPVEAGKFFPYEWPKE